MEEKFKMIMQLMKELESEMQPSEGDFAERLGREKPEVAVMSLEAGDGMEGDMPEGEMEMSDPDQALKDRISRLRG